jgi:hypothetical protein
VEAVRDPYILAQWEERRHQERRYPAGTTQVLKEVGGLGCPGEKGQLCSGAVHLDSSP